MPDRTSFMLDNIITAVDGGFSYDGIVSVSEAGLEDVEQRSGLAGSLRDSVEQVRMKSAAISRKAASVFKQKQRRRKLSQSTPGDGLGEKNRSDESLAPSDQQSEDLSDLTHAETDEENLFTRKGAVAQGVQLSRAPRPGDDEIDMAYGCFKGLLSTGSACSDTIRVEGTPLSHPDQKKLRKKRVEKGREVVTLIENSQGGLLGKNDEEEWEVLQHNSIEITKEEEEESVPIGKKGEVVIQQEKSPRKKVGVLHPSTSTVDQERQPRKRRGEEGRED